MKNFSNTLLYPGLESIAKDSFEKHIQRAQHLAALDLAQRKPLDRAAFNITNINDTPIGRGLKMCDKDREMMRTCFNAALSKKRTTLCNFC